MDAAARPGPAGAGSDVIHVSGQIAALQRVIDALGALPVRGVVTTGPALDAAALRPRENVTVVPSAPHRLVPQQAALVVTHGGHGTVIEALAAGVPMVVLPQAATRRTLPRACGARSGTRAEAECRSRSHRRRGEANLRDDSYRAAARLLGQAGCRDARSDALIRELEDIPNIQGRAS